MENEQEREQVRADTMCGCGHLMDGHYMLAYDNPLDGGLMLCGNLRDCDCAGTWSVQGRDTTGADKVLPPSHIVAEYRAALLDQLAAEDPGETLDGGELEDLAESLDQMRQGLVKPALTLEEEQQQRNEAAQ